MKFKVHGVTIREGDAKEKAKQAAADLRNAFAGFPVKALLLFASPVYDASVLAEETGRLFPGSTVFGCSSSGEMISGAMLDASVAAMACSDSAFHSVHLGLAENISTDPGALDKAVAALEAKTGCRLAELDYARNIGIILMDGISGERESILDRLGGLTDIMIAGGDAGDDMRMIHTDIYCGGRAYSDAALLAILAPTAAFSVIKSQSAEPTGTVVVATRVDERKRIVWEFDGKPAAAVYAEIIGLPVDELTMEHFVSRPLGLMIGGEPFIRSVESVIDGGGLRLFIAVKENMTLRVLKTGNIVSATAASLEQARRTFGPFSGLIDFSCALRRIDLRAHGQDAEYAALFKDFPAIGCNTYGETYIGHVNQTSIQIVFA